MGNRVWVVVVILSLCACSYGLVGPTVDEATVEVEGPVSATFEEPPAVITPGDLDPLYEGSFVENLGQARGANVAFYAVGDPLSVGFGTGFIEYAINGQDGREGSVVRVVLEGAEDARPVGVEPLGHTVNFFRGSDPEGWVSGARSFHQVTYLDLWPGIDLAFRLADGRLKYEFVVRPGADLDDISMVYIGVDGLKVDPGSGELLVVTPAGTLRDQAPWSYQSVGGRRDTVATSYRIDGGDTVTFQVSDYDPEVTLVIDPSLTFSTYIGGSSTETLWDMAVDSSGNVYVTGWTNSANYPIESGAYCSTMQGTKDIFVSKLSSNGTRLVYSTFLGGSNQDEARSIAVANRSAFIGGTTLSTDYPVTTGANQTSFGGSVDIVVTKLAANGSALLYSTYVGGSTGDFAQDIRVDSSGAAYVGGYSSGSFPTTSGAFDTSFDTNTDGVAFKLSPDGSTLVYSTYIGGNWDDRINGIAVDRWGNLYATGSTGSSNDSFPVTSGAFCTTEEDGTDGFVLRLNASGSGLYWCGLLSGSTSGTVGWCIDVDRWGDTYVAGETTVADLPTDNRSFDRMLNGTRDGFVANIDVNGSHIDYLTYLGGKSSDYIYDIQVDPKGQAHVTGRTSSTDFPTTEDAVNRTLIFGYDAFYTVVGQYGSSLEYSTYFGGDDTDEGWGVHVDATGTVTVAGWTQSTDLPTTTGAYCTTRPGGSDGFVIKLTPTVSPPEFGPDGTPTNVSVGTRMTFSINISDDTRVWNASVEYWYGNGIHDSHYLRRINGTTKDGVWTYRFDPQGTLDPLHYVFWARDEDGNVNKTTMRTITLTDDRGPEIDDNTPWANWPDGITTGDAFQFVAYVNDSIEVSEVRIHYTLGSPPWLDMNVTMDPWDVYWKGIGTYVLNMTAPSNTTGPYNYSIIATDSSGNTNIYEATIWISDNDRPELGPNLSDTGGTTGDLLQFRVNASDNIASFQVLLNYWFATGPVEEASMEPEAVAANGSGTYVFNLTVPTDYTGIIWYRFMASDSGNNTNVTTNFNLEVVDDDPPELGPDASHEGVDLYIFEVNATDNVGITSVWVEYTVWDMPPVNVSMDAISVEANGNGTYGNIEVPVNPSEQVRIDYTIGTTDGAGHLVTLQNTYMNMDYELPQFGEDGTWGEPVKGWQIAVWVEVWDNLGLEDVRVEYRFGDGDGEDVTMVDEGDRYNLTIDLPRWPDGDLYYTFHAVDTKGNWNSTIERSVVLVNKVPDISDLPEWEVTEGKLEVLDLEHYLSDANDGVSDLTLSTDAEGITVVRLRLNALYHEWKAPHTIEVSVTDGEDTTLFSIDITVINVNDPPEITSTLPPEGAVGQEYSYLVEFTDEDIGDTHTLGLFRMPVGMVVAGMTITWTPVEGQEGTHTVELGLSDGTSTVGQTWVITVTAPVNQPPAFTNAPVLTHTAGDHYEWNAEAEDPDGDDLTFTLVSGPEGAQMDASTGVLTWDPPADDRDRTENVAFVVRVSDDELQTNLPFTVDLTYPANQAPEVGPGLGEQKVNKDSRVDLTSYMSDPDDPIEDLHWTAETDADLFNVRMDGNVLVIEPKDDKKGQGKVMLNLYDPYGLVDTQELTVKVDTKEDVERDWCDSIWWIAIILLVLAAHILYMTQDRWRPKKEAAPMEEPDLEPATQEETGEEK